MWYNTTGSYNTASGLQSLYKNDSGNYNMANGYLALYNNIEGDDNTASGSFALYNHMADNATATGYAAMFNNTTGIQNTANGKNALYSNTIQSGNTAIGFESLYLNGVLGALATDNTAVGAVSLRNNNTGHRNTAIGYAAMNDNSSGAFNTALGASVLEINSTGSANTAVGYQALNANTTGLNNTAVGYNADVTIGSFSNATVIGANATVSSSNTMSFGNGTVDRWAFGIPTTSLQHALEVGNAATNGNGAFLTQGGTWTNTSDRNKKEDFSELNGGDLLLKIAQLSIQRWKYKGTNEYHIGPTAQQFYKLFNVGIDDKGISTVDPAGIALAAIQEQQKKIQKQEELIAALLKRIEVLEKK